VHVIKDVNGVLDSDRKDFACVHRCTDATNVELPFESVNDLLDCSPSECACVDGTTVVPAQAPATLPAPIKKFIGDLNPKQLLHTILNQVCDDGFTLDVSSRGRS
jgi:hypothetical protein